MLTASALGELSSTSGSFDEDHVGGVVVAPDQAVNSTHDDIRPHNPSGNASSNNLAASDNNLPQYDLLNNKPNAPATKTKIKPMTLLESDTESDLESVCSTSSNTFGYAEQDDDEVWYFAYGSNMNVAQLLTRIGPYEKKVLMKLEGYELAFNKKVAMRHTTNAIRAKAGFANVVPKPGAIVYGVGYRIKFSQLKIMDKYEGVRQHHYARELMTLEVPNDHEYVPAWVYVAEPGAVGEGLMPLDTYLSDLLGGRGVLPEQYVATLEKVESLRAADSVRQLMF